MTLEVLGAPKEHVEETLRKILAKFKEEKGSVITDLKVFDCEEQDNKMWSTFADVSFDIENSKKLMDICFDYMPSSIEIIDPAGFEVDSALFGEGLNDMLANLHKYTMVIKKLQSENIFMMKKLKGESI